MSDALVVLLEDQVAGTLTRRRGGGLRFSYEETYRGTADATPLSLSMPLALGEHGDAVVTPWLWGLLPDNDQVLERWAKRFQVSPASPFSLLASPVGEDCAGAVRFVDAKDVDGALARTGTVAWLTDEEVAKRLRDLQADATTWLGRNFTGQFSLGGAQAKTALLLQDGRWGVPGGALPTTHILKPAVAGLDDHDLNEHLCLDAASRTGLIVARTTVSRFESETAIVVTRYDRRESAPRELTRIHQEDLCQALGTPPSRKYQNEGGPNPRQIADLFRAVMPPSIARDAVQRFADALIWNWLIAGTDAHAKNYSLLLAGDQVRLAPLYDIASALPYDEHERKLKLAMKLGSSYDVYSRQNPWPGAARDLGLDGDALTARAHELAMRAPGAFAEAATAPDVVALERPLPERLAELVAERAARCAALLD
ncbi:serine/threonine-protein kinase HipA [Solirubrobacter pauli]|uniref:Serine/threonine-protein kinase HipA n=1 Tax=Solirubrobacter pauli TaxID=166793 RepID=A0A660LB41_9ACTN|nr:type II toxin-antitoxin system HipA family toxin [Solirubrobacter pauli]RKQ91626.1 serine/threonine-protein kinase HipA [Solirubrobacter pauli]